MYAIYFCLYFKWFSFQFSLNRYNRFKNKYLLDGGKTLTEELKEVYNKLLEIDIFKLIKEGAAKVQDLQRKPKMLIDVSVLLKKESAAKLKKISNWTLLSTDPEILFSRCTEFLLKLLPAVSQILLEW